LLADAAVAQAPHVHGKGTLKIAFQGGRILLELRAPAADIVGFERPPQTPEERNSVERALAELQNPLALFGLPLAARCAVAEAAVQAPGMTQAAGGAGALQPAHTDFEGAYFLHCIDAGAIRVIEFPFFDKFVRSEVLTVSLVTESGQTHYDVVRTKPRLDRGNSWWRWLTGR
jgi:hypothetical protein